MSCRFDGNVASRGGNDIYIASSITFDPASLLDCCSTSQSPKIMGKTEDVSYLLHDCEDLHDYFVSTEGVIVCLCIYSFFFFFFLGFDKYPNQPGDPACFESSPCRTISHILLFAMSIASLFIPEAVFPSSPVYIPDNLILVISSAVQEESQAVLKWGDVGSEEDGDVPLSLFTVGNAAGVTIKFLSIVHDGSSKGPIFIMRNLGYLIFQVWEDIFFII
jgi:hypothetical protein